MGAITTLKRLVAGASAGEYVCQNCDQHFALQHYSCPQCGCYSVEPAVEVPEAEAD